MQRATDFVQKYRMPIFSIVLFVFFALVIYYTHNIRLLVRTISVDAKFWPRVIGISGCVFSVLLFIQSLIAVGSPIAAEATQSGAGADGQPESVFDFHAIKTLGLIFLYVLGLQYLGFFLMTLLYLFCQFYILADREGRNVKRLALITVVFTPIIYVIFRHVFHMMLPTGVLWTHLGGMS